MEYTEDTPPSFADTVTKLCVDWENSASLPEDCKTRLVIMRIGVVLGHTGGVIQQSIWPFWLGLGGTGNVGGGLLSKFDVKMAVYWPSFFCMFIN